MILDAYRECPRCGGTGFRPFIGALFIRCRKCDGAGQVMKPSARMWARIRYGSGEDY